MDTSEQSSNNPALLHAEEIAPSSENFELALRGKRVCVFGLQGSGKTFISKFIGLHYNTLVFDIHGEWRSDFYYVLRPENKQYGPGLLGEFGIAMHKYVFSKEYKWDLLIVDEASQYFPNNRPLPPEMARLNDFNRHMDLAFLCIARRPTQLHTDLTELAHFNIFFRLTGVNDMKRLRDMYPGLDDAVFRLKEHECIVYETGKRFFKLKPVSVQN